MLIEHISKWLPEMIPSFVCIFSGFSDFIRKFIVFSVNLTKIAGESKKRCSFGSILCGKFGPDSWEDEQSSEVVAFSHIYGIFTRNLGEDEPKFDEHIFQRGWFNHQLVSQSQKKKSGVSISCTHFSGGIPY